MQSLLAAGILKHKIIPFKVNFYLWKSPWYTKCVSNFQCYFNAFQLSFFSWMFKWRHGRDQWVSLVDRAKPVSKSHNHTSILPLWYMAPTQSSSQLSLCKLQVAIFFLYRTPALERETIAVIKTVSQLVFGYLQVFHTVGRSQIFRFISL